jgi:adenosylmethionine-8-amino-7-oxononanoate aminotransferase
VLVRELDRAYPLIVRGRGVWLEDRDGMRYLDAISGGAMVTSLGHGPNPAIAAAAAQAQEISFVYDQQFTSPPQEALAEELCAIAPAGFERVHFTSGGAEANETALRLARSYHVERGDRARTRIISPAQAYHGPTMATLGLTGRAALRAPYDPFIAPQLRIPPSTWRFDPTGADALEAPSGSTPRPPAAGARRARAGSTRRWSRSAESGRATPVAARGARAGCR